MIAQGSELIVNFAGPWKLFDAFWKLSMGFEIFFDPWSCHHLLVVNVFIFAQSLEMTRFYQKKNENSQSFVNPDFVVDFTKIKKYEKALEIEEKNLTS